MGKINWGRVFLGGLAAGVVANVVVSASWFLFLGKAWAAALQEIGRPVQETTIGDHVFWIVWFFVMGITTVWLYAAIRPRFSPGAKTALIAGFAYWVLGDLLPRFAWGFLTKFPTAWLATDALMMLVAVVLATLAGAWVYKEA